MYSRSSHSKASIEKLGSRNFMLRNTRAVSFSSNHDATVDVTERSDDTTGFSNSWYTPCSSETLRRIGFVSLGCCQRLDVGRRRVGQEHHPLWKEARYWARGAGGADGLW